MQPSATLVSTREAMHRIAEHILSPARHAAEGRIGLRPAPYGMATPPFGPQGRVVALDGPELAVRDGVGPTAGQGERREVVSTLRAAGVFVGVQPGAPASLYPPSTPLDLDEPLVLDPAAQLLLADWFALGEAALARFAPGTEATLWPEHFDLAVVVDEVNYGFSPGDGAVPSPYVYVGPHWGPQGPPAPDGFWNQPFGASRQIDQVGSLDAALAFFEEGRERALKARG